MSEIMNSKIPHPLKQGEFLILKHENIDVNYKKRNFSVVKPYYIEENGNERFTTYESDDVFYFNMISEYNKIILLEKLSTQVHTIPSIRNKLSPITNLLSLLEMLNVSSDDNEIMDLYKKNIENVKKSIEILINPSTDGVDTFNDIDI